MEIPQVLRVFNRLTLVCRIKGIRACFYFDDNNAFRQNKNRVDPPTQSIQRELQQKLPIRCRRHINQQSA